MKPDAGCFKQIRAHDDHVRFADQMRAKSDDQGVLMRERAEVVSHIPGARRMCVPPPPYPLAGLAIRMIKRVGGLSPVLFLS